MSPKRQLAELLEELPESPTVEETMTRLIHAFRRKRALAGASSGTPRKQPQAPAERIVQLLDEERVGEARDLAASVEDPRWAKVLAPAVVSVGPEASGRDVIGQVTALQTPLDSYTGQWVAVRGGTVIDSSSRRAELHRRLASRGLLGGTVFMKVED